MKYQVVIQTVQMLEMSILAVISKIYSHISLSQKNKITATAFNVVTVLIKCGGGSQPESLQNHVGNIGWCQCGKYHAETQEIDCLCYKDLAALEELKFEGKLFYVIF